MNDDDWIEAREVYQLVMGVPHILREMETRASTDLMQTRAELRIERRAGAESRFENEAVPQWVWKSIERSVLVRYPTCEFDWNRGRITSRRIWDENNSCLELEVIGASFLRSEVARFLPSDSLPVAAEATTLAAVPPVARGVKAEPKWNWEAALVDLLALAELEGLVDTFELNKRGGQRKLEKWLTSWFEARHEGEAPSDTEVRKRAQAIMRSLPSV